MHPLLPSNWSFIEETELQSRSRYSGFGCRIFELMKVEMPEEHRALKFYHSKDLQPEDAYAICDREHPFAIQLDPDCQVICLWNDLKHIEIGTWSSEPYKDAFAFIREYFTNPTDN